MYRNNYNTLWGCREGGRFMEEASFEQDLKGRFGHEIKGKESRLKKNYQ